MVSKLIKVKIKYSYTILGCSCEVPFWDVPAAPWLGCCDWLLFWPGSCDWLLLWLGSCDWLEVSSAWDCDWLGVCDSSLSMATSLFSSRACWEVLLCGGDALLLSIGDEDSSLPLCRFWKMQYKNIMSKLNTSGRYKQQFFFIHVPSINEYILGSYTSLYDEQKPHTEYCTESHKYLYLYINS